MNFIEKIKKKTFLFNFDFFTEKKVLIYCLRNHYYNFRFIEKKFNNQVFFLFRNEYNFFIYLAAFLRIFFPQEKNLFSRYLLIYLKLKRIKVIVSDHDNDIQLYLIKKKLKSVKVILIQNGTRASYGDIFWKIKKNKDYKVDDFIVLNEDIKNKYKNYVNAKYHIFGSCRLNTFLMHQKRKPKIQKNTIVYISQYREALEKQKILPDNQIVRFLNNFCEKKKINFRINLKYKSNTANFFKEKNHFKKIIACDDNKFFFNKNSLESYRNVLRSNLIITCDSTMGYETLSLKRKTFFISIRGGKYRTGCQFGWPGSYKKEGFFWSKFLVEKKIERKLDTLINCNKFEWFKKIKKYKKNIAFQDYNFSTKINMMIRKYLKN